jgi:hypothetical protein
MEFEFAKLFQGRGSALAEHLRSIGLSAELLEGDDPKAPPRRFFDLDRTWVRVEGQHFDLVGVKMGGFFAPKLSNASFSIGVGRLNLPMRSVLPFADHYLIDRRPTPYPPHFRVDLVRRDGDFSWNGGALGRALTSDGLLEALLESGLKEHDELLVEPDESLARVRVIHRTRMVGGLLAIGSEIIDAENGLPSRDLVLAIDRIARHVGAANPGSMKA